MAGHLPSMPRLWFRFSALLKKIRGGEGEREGGKKKDGRRERGASQEEAMEELEICFSG